MIHSASWADLSPARLHDIIRLRVDVFVVEQQCPYPELDGRDTEESTVHVWAERNDVVVAYLRLLTDPDGPRRIGRVCVAPNARGEGLARELMVTALDLVGADGVTLNAQAYLVGWYERFGFAACGPEFLDDGIAHVPMRRAAG